MLQLKEQCGDGHNLTTTQQDDAAAIRRGVRGKTAVAVNPLSLHHALRGVMVMVLVSRFVIVWSRGKRSFIDHLSLTLVEKKSYDINHMFQYACRV
jgi:hypothetical protein